MYERGTKLFMVKGVSKSGDVIILEGIMQYGTSVHSGGQAYFNPSAWSTSREEAVKVALQNNIRQKKRTEKALGTIVKNIEALHAFKP